MLDALALAKQVFMVEGAQEEVVFGGQTEAVEFILIVLQLHGALSVRVGGGMGQVTGSATHALAQIVGLLGRQREETLIKLDSTFLQSFSQHISL